MKIRFIFIALLSVLLPLLTSLITSSSSSANTQSSAKSQGRLLTIDELPAKNKRYALIIGVDKYEDSKISTLHGATNDAKTLAKALVDYAGFPQDQVVLLTNDQSFEHQPRRNIVLAALSNLVATAKKDHGLLLISFAGHGIERGGRPFLLSADAQLGSEFDLDLLEDTALSVNKMKDRLKGLDQVILILDACRNDPQAGRGGSENKLTDSFARSFNFDVKNQEVKAFATLYATSPGQISYEYKEKEQGYFTWALVEALKGEAGNIANDKGELTLGKLVAYLQERVPKLVSVNLGKQQKPNLVVEGYRPDDLVISVTVTIGNNKTSSANVTNNSAASASASYELEFWNSVKDSKNAKKIQAYLDEYPTGRFARLAKIEIESLESTNNNSSSNTSSTRLPPTTTSTTSGAAPAGGAKPTMRSFTFETVGTNSTGGVASRRNGQAGYYVEDLNGVKLEMVEVPAGSFYMGSSDSDADQFKRDLERYGFSQTEAAECVGWEKPQHQVRVNGFYIGKFEVTQVQWQAIMGTNPADFKGNDLPVEEVSWNEAVEFCHRLSQKTGREYRLPSEAEWEYACRASSTTVFAFGETVISDLVNYNGDYPYSAASKGIYREKTTPVGSLRIANAFGLYDMHGNVWEWCQDIWHTSYNGAPTDGTAWESSGDDNYRVLRGGSWLNFGYRCRSAYRNRDTSGNKYYYNGFRVVVSVARTH